MKIQHVTFQGGEKNDPRPFSELYEGWFAPIETSEGPNELVSHMVKLLQHLEREVDAPPMWANTSHFNVVLRPRDYEEYGESADDEEITVVIISMDPWFNGYHISCQLPKSAHPWHSFGGSTDDIKTAGQMVAEGLRKAPEVTRVLRE